MSDSFLVACVQNRAGADMGASIAQCERLIREAHRRRADLICLPEFLSCLDMRERRLEVGILPEEEHPALARFCTLASDLEVWLLLGSLAIEARPGRTHNRSYVIDTAGAIVARYNKIHMFDVDLEGGQSFRESEVFEPGRDAVLAPTPWGQLGLTVCYDLRFPYLYRTLAQAGASILTVPAAFTRTTGQAHWHVLLRSRANRNRVLHRRPLPVRRARRSRDVRTFVDRGPLGHGARRRRRDGERHRRRDRSGAYDASQAHDPGAAQRSQRAGARAGGGPARQRVIDG